MPHERRLGRVCIDRQWRFHRGDIDYPRDHSGWAKAGQFGWGPCGAEFDDGNWRLVDLPHDFVVEGDFTERPHTFGPCSPREVDHGLHKCHGSLSGGVGWYRKVLELPAADAQKRLWLEFGGVFRNSTVYLNGHFVGTHLSGYTGFRYDITDIANCGGPNVLAVRADATEYEGWFYEGGGIYRHVWLVKADPLRLEHDGTFIDCRLADDNSAARVSVHCDVVNDGDADAAASVSWSVLAPDGEEVASCQATCAVAAGGGARARASLDLTRPHLWSPESPRLYTLVTTLRGGGYEDRTEITFGVRSIRFDGQKGFFLNGRHTLLKGVCCHQDHAGVGAALPDRLQDWRIARLKEIGVNAYRTSHNPPTPELLDACDRLGMLVMDETRMLSSAPECAEQLRSLVLRDRNHPCVIMWSLGNEEHKVQGTDVGLRTTRTLRRLVRRLDPSRPVTVAMNGAWGKGASLAVDVQGCNYIHCGKLDEFRQALPHLPVVFTESASMLCTRGIYSDDPGKCHCNSYTGVLMGWSHTAEANWQYCAERPFVAGTFVWTGFDYRGEPTPHKWPCVASHFGVLDTCGFDKDAAYYYRAWWGEAPSIHIFPHWNWPERLGQDIDVWCYANCEQVELLLNGRSLGRKDMPLRGHLEWKAPYEPGVLLAVGYSGGRPAVAADGGPLQCRRETTGAPAAVRLLPDRAAIAGDGCDVAVLTVEVVDSQGRVVPIADNEVFFEVSDCGRIIGTGNGNPTSHESDKAPRRRAFNGLAQVIVQSVKPGSIVLTASSPGLIGATAAIEAVRKAR